MTRLLHYSSKPITAVYSVSQGPGLEHHRYDKPRGLWLSVEGEDDWRSWCEAESLGNPAGQPTPLALRPPSPTHGPERTRESGMPARRPLGVPGVVNQP